MNDLTASASGFERSEAYTCTECIKKRKKKKIMIRNLRRDSACKRAASQFCKLWPCPTTGLFLYWAAPNWKLDNICPHWCPTHLQLVVMVKVTGVAAMIHPSAEVAFHSFVLVACMMKYPTTD